MLEVYGPTLPHTWPDAKIYHSEVNSRLDLQRHMTRSGIVAFAVQAAECTVVTGDSAQGFDQRLSYSRILSNIVVFKEPQKSIGNYSGSYNTQPTDVFKELHIEN